MGVDSSLVASWIAAVPNVIWSGLLASTVTLAGVQIADWRNTVRQRRQHCFDEEQARIDRTMDIRSEVYLPVSVKKRMPRIWRERCARLVIKKCD
jgi:hypothetical protein